MYVCVCVCVWVSVCVCDTNLSKNSQADKLYN